MFHKDLVPDNSYSVIIGTLCCKHPVQHHPSGVLLGLGGDRLFSGSWSQTKTDMTQFLLHGIAHYPAERRRGASFVPRNSASFTVAPSPSSDPATFFHSPVIRWSCGRVLLQPICFKAQWVVRCEMPQCTLMLYSAVMCIFVAHLVAWMNVAILPSPQDETADCMFLNHWIQLCVDGQNQMLKITETFVFY